MDKRFLLGTNLVLKARVLQCQSCSLATLITCFASLRTHLCASHLLNFLFSLYIRISVGLSIVENEMPLYL